MQAKLYLISALFLLTAQGLSCFSGGIGGVGWDAREDVEALNNFPSVQSERTQVTTEPVPYQTFRQEFNTVFDDFPSKGDPVLKGDPELKETTRIGDSIYAISYEPFVLKIFRGDTVVLERKLPKVFYMHPMNSAVIPGNSQVDDLILCRIRSRATTGRHYVLIANGNGEILYERILKAGDDWNILPAENGKIIIGGANTKTTISFSK